MRSESDRYRLIHIRDNIVKATLFVDGLSYEQFRDDEKSFYAVTRALEIISEASRKLSADLKGRHPGLTLERHRRSRKHLSPRLRGRNAPARLANRS